MAGWTSTSATVMNRDSAIAGILSLLAMSITNTHVLSLFSSRKYACSTSKAKGFVWFTEWSEKKIDELGISVSVAEESLVVDASSNERNEVFMTVAPRQQDLDEHVKMISAVSISSSGRLWNMTRDFDRDAFYLADNSPQTVTLTLTSDPNLVAGDYTLTVGAKYGEVTVSKTVKLSVT